MRDVGQHARDLPEQLFFQIDYWLPEYCIGSKWGTSLGGGLHQETVMAEFGLCKLLHNDLKLAMSHFHVTTDAFETV